MPTKTDIIINATDANNKKVTNTISYVNPNLSDNTALTLAQKFNALTTNSYQSTEKITRSNIEAKVEPTFSIWGIIFDSTSGGNKSATWQNGGTYTIRTDLLSNNPTATGGNGKFFQMIIQPYSITDYEGVLDLSPRYSFNSPNLEFGKGEIYGSQSNINYKNRWFCQIVVLELETFTADISLHLTGNNIYGDSDFTYTVNFLYQGSD